MTQHGKERPASDRSESTFYRVTDAGEDFRRQGFLFEVVTASRSVALTRTLDDAQRVAGLLELHRWDDAIFR